MLMAEESIGAWGAAGIAFGSSLLGAVAGALAAVVGARWATRADLLERNRHALLMEDTQRYWRSRLNLEAQRSPEADAKADIERMNALDQIEVRTQLLGGREAELGRTLAEHREADGDRGNRVRELVVEIEQAARANL